MNAQITIRIDPELKVMANNFARSEGKNVNQVVRGLLEEYVKDRDIGSYVDDLWDRVGDEIKSKGTGRKDIRRIIGEVRSGK